MSQYFLACNIRKKEYIHPHCFGCFAKESELLQSPLFTKAVCYLLTRSFPGDANILTCEGGVPELKGTWSGNIVRILGEYDPLVLHTYNEIMLFWKDISRDVIHEMCIIDGFLTLEELKILEEIYEGDDNKPIRRSIHIAQSYARKRAKQMEATA